MTTERLYKLCVDLNPFSVRAYLNNTGWDEIKSKREHIAILTKSIEGKFEEILLPLSRTFSDFNKLMVSAVKSISIIENTTEIKVVNHLNKKSKFSTTQIRDIRKFKKHPYATTNKHGLHGYNSCLINPITLNSLISKGCVEYYGDASNNKASLFILTEYGRSVNP